MYRLFLIAVLSFFAIGCSTTQVVQIETKATPVESYILTQNLKPLSVIKAFKFRGWRSLDSEHLIISTTPQKPYLIALNAPCEALEHTQGISINHKGTSVLHAHSDSISVPQQPQRKCFIKTIYALTSEQADEIARLNKQLANS